MKKVTVELGERSYEIIIGTNILSHIGEKIKSYSFSKIAIISNPTVYNLYGKTIKDSLDREGIESIEILIPDGEQYKDYFWTYHILTESLKNKLDRRSCLIALGGGVIGDITGFSASIYMRGIDFIQVPTTFLAQVDSSVGGKTGVNHYLGKNMIGTFHQPKFVWIDIDTLKTLPKRELLSGISESIKYGVIWDGNLFSYMKKNRYDVLSLNPNIIAHIINRSCEIKAEIVSLDEREAGLRAILNYGHTIGHAIETETNYSRFLHGEAIAIGMHLEAKLAEIIGLIDKDKVSEIKGLIDDYGLPSELPNDINLDKLISHMEMDKKVLAGKMNFILPENIGKVIIYKDVNPRDIKRALSGNFI